MFHPESKRASVRGLVVLAFMLCVFAPRAARADENGISFWLPGFYGSLAASPLQPGFSFASIYYHTSVSASGSVAAAREVTLGGRTATLNTNLNANVNADVDLGLLIPSYTFATPVLGGQLMFGLMTVVGHNSTSLDGTLTAGVGNINISRTGSIDSSVGGFGDLAPSASLRWNDGVNNFMLYGTGDIPVGAYDPNRLANLGIGHGAIDGGFGYTYLNPQNGWEASVVTGLTYNFENPDTNYQSGVDWHTDWGVSKFLSKQLLIGAVGYFYTQISPDTGQAAFLGNFESRVFGAGPQIGYIFPINDDTQGYLNLKGYGEFGARNRPSGWNLWLTFSISPAEKKKSPASTEMFHK